MRKLMWFVCILVLCSSQLIYAQVTIDNFNTGSIALSYPGGPNSGKNTGLMDADTIGGRRELDIFRDTGVGIVDGDINDLIAPQIFSFSTTTNTTGHFNLKWGDYISSPDNQALNLNIAAYTQIQIDVVSVDQQIDNLWLALNDGTEEAHYITIPALGTGVYSWNLSNFTSTNFADIDGIRLYTTTSRPALDFAIDYVQAVPEPSTYIILAFLGLIGYGYFRLKKAEK
jgi:hypothetical protein